jgi:branched-chain amino acid transport system permease protein
MLDSLFDGYTRSMFIFAGINIIAAYSFYAPFKTGQVSLGQAGFMAIGAYTSAVMTKAGYPFALALPAGALLAAVAGLLVGTPALRVRGMYLMILTLGFGEIVRVFFLNFEPTGGPSGLGGILPLTDLSWVFGTCVVVLVVLFRIRGSRLGHAMIAVHEDDVAAEAMGINLLRIKLVAFSLGALIAGLAGGLYAHQALFIDANQFDFARSAVAFLYVVLGGPATPLGPVVGAAILTLAPEVLRVIQEWRMTFVGLLLVVVAIWRPNGLIPAIRWRR